MSNMYYRKIQEYSTYNKLPASVNCQLNAGVKISAAVRISLEVVWVFTETMHVYM